MRNDAVREFIIRQGHLPHWESPGAAYFVSFNLQKRGLVDLSERVFAELIISALQHFDGSRYDLYDYSVMPDHVHCILRLPISQGASEPLWKVTQSLKSWLARRINGIAGREGQVWQVESHDHILRNREDYLEKARYIYNNPCAAGLVGDPADWPWWGRGKGQ